jgi:hypothetical protein
LLYFQSLQLGWYQYRKLLKHPIIKKHKALTDEALLVSKLYDKLQERKEEG